jgi:triosephosphate isomerase
MLSEAGCDACLVGHSERRALFGDTDEVMLAKVRRLLEVEVQPIFCIGETLEQRDLGQATNVVTSQLALLLDNLSSETLGKIAVAYEPVWAIGTGRTASPEQAQAMHECIRDYVRQKDAELAEKMVLLYGGSVNADNSSELFAQPDIDGGLVGGASLQADNFAQICKSIECR